MNNRMIHFIGVALVGMIGAFTGFAHAAVEVGQITHLSGLLTTKRADGSTRVFSVKSQIQEGDTLTTERDTYARIKFVDGSEVVLRPSSQMQVQEFKFDEAKPEKDNVLLSMFKGGLRAVTGLIGKRSRDAVNYKTATATVGIRGTHFGMLICNNDCANIPRPAGMAAPANGLHLDVTSGAIKVTNTAGTLDINSGGFGFVAQPIPGSPLVKPEIAKPEQVIKVTMPVSIAQDVRVAAKDCSVQ